MGRDWLSPTSKNPLDLRMSFPTFPCNDVINVAHFVLIHTDCSQLVQSDEFQKTLKITIETLSDSFISRIRIGLARLSPVLEKSISLQLN
jgi:hypothetical protein